MHPDIEAILLCTTWAIGCQSLPMHKQCFADIGVHAQELKAASASSDAFERVSKQIDLMYSIAKAFPLTNPQVFPQRDFTACGFLLGFDANSSMSFGSISSIWWHMALCCGNVIEVLLWTWHNSVHKLFSIYQHN